jgi:hypothetical protein
MRGIVVSTVACGSVGNVCPNPGGENKGRAARTVIIYARIDER